MNAVETTTQASTSVSASSNEQSTPLANGQEESEFAALAMGSGLSGLLGGSAASMSASKTLERKDRYQSAANCINSGDLDGLKEIVLADEKDTEVDAKVVLKVGAAGESLLHVAGE